MTRKSTSDNLGTKTSTHDVVEPLLLQSGQTSCNFVQLTAFDLDNLVQAGIDMATRHVLDQHLVFTNVPRQHDLVVRGVAGIRAYAGLLDYLQSLEFIDSVMVLGLQADALTLRINSVATDLQLRSLLIDDGQFDRAPQTVQLPLPESATNLEFIWLGAS